MALFKAVTGDPLEQTKFTLTALRKVERMCFNKTEIN